MEGVTTHGQDARAGHGGTKAKEVPGQEGWWEEAAHDESAQPGSSPEEPTEQWQNGDRRDGSEGTAACGEAHA